MGCEIANVLLDSICKGYCMLNYSSGNGKKEFILYYFVVYNGKKLRKYGIVMERPPYIATGW